MSSLFLQRNSESFAGSPLGVRDNYVLLDEGFMLDGTSEAYFDVIDCFPNQYIGRQSSPNPPEPPSYYWLKKKGFVE